MKYNKPLHKILIEVSKSDTSLNNLELKTFLNDKYEIDRINEFIEILIINDDVIDTRGKDEISILGKNKTSIAVTNKKYLKGNYHQSLNTLDINNDIKIPIAKPPRKIKTGEWVMIMLTIMIIILMLVLN